MKVKLLALLLFCSSCMAIGSKKEVTEYKTPKTAESTKKCDQEKCSLTIPDVIKTSVSEEDWYYALLRLVFNIIQSEYVDNISECNLTEKAISGLLSTFDPHSCYLSGSALSSLQMSTEGEFGGIGIEMISDEGLIKIISPIDDTPAYKAGLKSGDLIIGINDEYVGAMTQEEMITKLRGAPKTEVILKIKRANKVPFNVAVTRELIKIQSVKAEILDNVAYIRISAFDKNTSKEIKKFLLSLKTKRSLFGIVIDLRNNPGGLLDEAIAVSDLFLDGTKKITEIRGRSEINNKIYSSTPGDASKGLPIVVLINSGTASASEIVASALKDNNRGIVVGTRSFGKGSVQKVIPISEKAAIKLTVAKYYSPNGECIQAKGVVPDIIADYAMIKKPEFVFELREEMFNNALDADKNTKKRKHLEIQSMKALDNLSKKKEKDEKEDDEELSYRKLSLKERVEKDYQLSKAFDTIKSIGHYKEIVNVKCVK